jgi:hypothetical protein
VIPHTSLPKMVNSLLSDNIVTLAKNESVMSKGCWAWAAGINIGKMKITMRAPIHLFLEIIVHLLISFLFLFFSEIVVDDFSKRQTAFSYLILGCNDLQYGYIPQRIGRKRTKFQRSFSSPHFLSFEL